MENKFKIGDVVILNSGSCKMTICAITPNGKYQTVGYDTDVFTLNDVDALCLTKVVAHAENSNGSAMVSWVNKGPYTPEIRQ